MSYPVSFSTVAEILNIDTATLPQGAAFVCVALKAWLILDKTSTEAVISNQIFTPLVGTGRWYRNQNVNNRLNNVPITVAANTTLDFTSVENIVMTLTSNSPIIFSTILRDGTGTLLIERGLNTSFQITSYDSRIKWGSNSFFAFSTGQTKVIFDFLTVNNIIYIMNAIAY